MPEDITAYSMPNGVKTDILDLAGKSDLLILGEMHGTQEVPRLALGLLPDLAALNYGALALEMPSGEREQLLLCINGEAEPPAMFQPRDFRDGRGNVQALSLIRQAVQIGWTILCFDVDTIAFGDTWADRDRGMAENLLRQRETYCPGQKVLGICGNYHSRLVPPDDRSEFWPSFAYSAQQSRPDLVVSSINIVFHAGEFYNGEVRKFGKRDDSDLREPEFRPANALGHTIDLHLPTASAVTFLDTDS